MKTALYAAAAVLSLGVASADAQGRHTWSEPRDSRARVDNRRIDRYDDHADGRRDLSGTVHVVFSTGDRHIVREYYEPRYRRLPPGLQKKYARTGSLPPGWQKKIHPLPWAVERRLTVLPREYRRGVIDDHAVIYAPRSGVVIDAAILF